MILKCLHIYHAFFFNMFFKKLLFFLHYSISGLSDIIKTKTPGFIVFQIVLHYLLPLKSEMCHCRSGTLLPFSSSLYIPNSWIVFFLLFVFFFQQCGHLACLTVLTCQVKKKKKKKKALSHLTWVLWSLWNTFHSSACSNLSKKKIERLLLSCGQSNKPFYFFENNILKKN